eukprot:scaffold3339_cov174-Amphora_coffeaeformis.AAC.7
MNHDAVHGRRGAEDFLPVVYEKRNRNDEPRGRERALSQHTTDRLLDCCMPVEEEIWVTSQEASSRFGTIIKTTLLY